ncbi:MAG: hypothetical protein AAF456_14825 [Planctomycetota bacterium]
MNPKRKDVRTTARALFAGQKSDIAYRDEIMRVALITFFTLLSALVQTAPAQEQGPTAVRFRVTDIPVTEDNAIRRGTDQTTGCFDTCTIPVDEIASLRDASRYANPNFIQADAIAVSSGDLSENVVQASAAPRIEPVEQPPFETEPLVDFLPVFQMNEPTPHEFGEAQPLEIPCQEEIVSVLEPGSILEEVAPVEPPAEHIEATVLEEAEPIRLQSHQEQMFAENGDPIVPEDWSITEIELPQGDYEMLQSLDGLNFAPEAVEETGQVEALEELPVEIDIEDEFELPVAAVPMDRVASVQPGYNARPEYIDYRDAEYVDAAPESRYVPEPRTSTYNYVDQQPVRYAENWNDNRQMSANALYRAQYEDPSRSDEALYAEMSARTGYTESVGLPGQDRFLRGDFTNAIIESYPGEGPGEIAANRWGSRWFPNNDRFPSYNSGLGYNYFSSEGCCDEWAGRCMLRRIYYDCDCSNELGIIRCRCEDRCGCPTLTPAEREREACFDECGYGSSSEVYWQQGCRTPCNDCGDCGGR